MNGKAHNFVFCNWLMMSSPENLIRMILEAGLSSVPQKNLDFFIFMYKAYLYGTVEEFVMFTLIYFNRSQHAFALLGTFKCSHGFDALCQVGVKAQELLALLTEAFDL